MVLIFSQSSTIYLSPKIIILQNNQQKMTTLEIHTSVDAINVYAITRNYSKRTIQCKTVYLGYKESVFYNYLSSIEKKTLNHKLKDIQLLKKTKSTFWIVFFFMKKFNEFFVTGKCHKMCTDKMSKTFYMKFVNYLSVFFSKNIIPMH